MIKLKGGFAYDVLPLALWNQMDSYIVAKQSKNFGNL